MDTFYAKKLPVFIEHKRFLNDRMLYRVLLQSALQNDGISLHATKTRSLTEKPKLTFP